MAQFSITEAALTGFRVVRERPSAVLGWAAVYLVLLGASWVALTSVAGPAIAEVQSHGLPSDPAAFRSFMQQIGLAEPPMLGLSLLSGAVFAAAMNRAVMTPDDKGLAYMKLGRDELAQLGLKLFLLLLSLSVNILAVGLAQGLAAVGGMLGPGGAALAGLADTAASVGALIGLIYLNLRLSLASAASFDQRRIDLRTSWRMTRGRVGEILSAYALAFALTGLVLALGLVIVLLLTGALAALIDPTNSIKPNLSTPYGLLAPLPLTTLCLMALLFGLTAPLLSTPGAFIYQRLAKADASPEPGRKSDFYA
ncbi:hypothetical protein [Phenylobacterium montanum]|uniref:Uncharacterized protein n=1 Tax=Phenylobacterium montanum TaxID=2823693 RepID=A0A975IWV6_9CAUL|nr:hypothetical protein [Caulobacter sp. S6]QUD89984.1 hypothetical protein KCG34_09010 [Caulobacter sp. S6]